MDRDCGLICKSPQFSEKETAEPRFGGQNRPWRPEQAHSFPGRPNTPEQAQTSAEAAFSALPLGSEKPERDGFDTDSMVEEALLRIEPSPDVDEVLRFDPRNACLGYANLETHALPSSA